MSNCEIKTQLQAKYREYLQTEIGRKHLSKALAIKREWKESQSHCDATFTTDNVKPKLTHLADKMKLLTIVPIGLNNMCHINANLFCGENITSVLGFNITSCPCGYMSSYELHSVNKVGDELVDFTRDFNEEATKYFLPVETTLKPSQYIQLFGKDPIAIETGKCRCPIEWKWVKSYKTTVEKFDRHIRTMEETIVMEHPDGGAYIMSR